MKKWVVFTFALMLFFSGCVGSVDDPLYDPNAPNGPSKYSKELWGEWIRMDTGDIWYITSKSIKVNNYNFTTDVTLNKQSDRVIEVTYANGARRYLYASRIATSSFSGKVSSIGAGSNTQNLIRAASSGGIGGIDVIISNLNDKAEEIITKTDNDGNFTVDDIIAGDEYQIKAEDQTTVVLPHADGDDIGTITVTNGVNFKTTIRPRETTTDMNKLYANTSYYLNIEIQNTGTQDCTAATYSLTLDSDLTTSSSLSGILGTIEPKKKKIISLSLNCKAITNEYEFKKISIVIKDNISGKNWDDSVSIKFNKAKMNFYIRSARNSSVQGVVITPTAKAYFFKTLSDYRPYLLVLDMPWSTKDYLIVFSGATANTEAAYSFGINMNPDTDYSNFLDLGNYEPNNTESDATLIDINVQNNIMSYLHKNDIDYFRIRLGTSVPIVKTFSITDYAIIEYNGNNDAQANPGESIYLDIRIRDNVSGSYISSATLSSTSSYVTIDKGMTSQIGGFNIYEGQIYKTLTDYNSGGYCNLYDSALNAKLLYSPYLSRAFRFTIATGCPVGTELPFTVTFSDSGRTWTDSLTIPVY